MSRAFLDSFFPGVLCFLARAADRKSAVVPSWLHTIYNDYLFPQTNNYLCPTPIMKLPLFLLFNDNNNNNVTRDDDQYFVIIRNPILLLHAIMGCILGLYGAYRLPSCSTWSRASLSTVSSSSVKQNVRNKDNNNNNYFLWWRISFFFFGLMNLVAIPLHSLLPLNDTDNTANSIDDESQPQQLPQLYPWLWMLDTFFTGTSSCAIVMACWNNYKLDKYNDNKNTKTTMGTTTEWQYYGVMQSIGLLCVVIFFSSNNNNPMKTIPLELWYLLPTLFAAHTSVALLLMGRKNNHGKGKSNCHDRKQETSTTIRTTRRTLIPISMLYLAGIFVGGGFLADAWFCRNMHFSFHLYDGLMVASLTFAGCNIAFGGLFYRLHHYFNQQEKQSSRAAIMMMEPCKQA